MATKKKRKASAAALRQVPAREETSIARVPGRLPTADITSDRQRKCLEAAVLLTRERRKITKRALSDKVGKSESQSQSHLRALIKSKCIEAITEKRDVVVGYKVTELGENTYDELKALNRIPQ